MTLFLILITACLAQRPDSSPGNRPLPRREAALQKTFAVTTGLREDDHPAIASRGGSAWVAWVSYSEAEHTALVFARSWTSGKWAEPLRVTDTAGDYHKPAVTIDDAGVVHIAWAAQVAGNWDIYQRKRSGTAWSAVERVTTDPAPDFGPQLASAKGKTMLVWSSFRRGNLDVMGRVNGGVEELISDSAASDWEPVVAATPDGAFHVAWDSYRGDYDVLMKSWRDGKWGGEVAVASSPKLENHASITADARNRLWIAWEVGPENWASDSANGGLRPTRQIGMACLDGGRLSRVPDLKAKSPQAPVLAAAPNGSVWLFFREPMNKNWLTVKATQWDGAQWDTPEPMIYSEGRIDQRIVAAAVGSNQTMMVYPAGSLHSYIYGRVFPAAAGTPPLSPVEPQSIKAAPARAPRHTFQGRTVVWGDLHRHTDISEDGGIDDGSLMDAMRYAIDAGGLDYLGITDHTRYLPRRYNLYRIQQIADIFNKPGAFTGLHAYERSQFSPWGHRNVVHLNRNYTPVPASYDIGDQGVSPWGLFEALRGRKALSIPHTSAWIDKQVSWDYFDPQVERLVEIYQGLRSTYEYNGAPDPADRVVYEKDSKNFVWDALAKGRRLGFIASSDHRSTHMSFAAVYVKNTDRASVFEGLTARRTYAATDKILVDFAIGPAPMGSEITLTAPPEIKVAVEGTNLIARIDVIKDGTFAYTVEPKTTKASFTFRDEGSKAGESYYYVRVIQTDKMMAWASPIWVTRK